jgi:hypothetical protein
MLPLRLFTRLLPLGMVAVLLSACAVATVERGPREWTTSIERTDGSVHAIRVTDGTGKIDEIVIDPAGVPIPETVVQAPGSDRTILVPWVGGSCDATTAIDITADGDAVDVGIAITTGAEACDAMAIGHVVAITFNLPVTPDQVTVQR